MTIRRLAALALAAGLLWGEPRTAAADDAKLPDAKAFDKLVIDTLRDVHNKGADLYNTAKDFPGAYRVYQGALVTVRPLLAHRPEAQKIIDAGLSDADKEADVARKAFLLHGTIESVRKNLKTGIGAKNPEVVKKPEEKKKPAEPPKKPVEPPKKPDPVPVAPKPKEPKPKEPKPKEPKPKEPKPKEPAAVGGAASVSGKVTLAGKPLAAGELSIVSLNLPKPHVFTTAVKDGGYKFAEAIPAGKYAAIVTGKGVPDKYALVNTSGLTVDLKADTNDANIVLK